MIFVEGKLYKFNNIRLLDSIIYPYRFPFIPKLDKNNRLQLTLILLCTDTSVKDRIKFLSGEKIVILCVRDINGKEDDIERVGD